MGISKMKLMNLGKKIGRVFGLDIKRLKSADFNYKWLESLGIHTIIDIGASIGEFSKMIRKILPEAQIYAFEPLKTSYLKLVSNTRHLSKFQAFNFALGEQDDDDAEIHHWGYSPSSSFLSMADLHKKAFPRVGDETVENVRMRRLDGIARDLDIKEHILIKIDVQGYEDKVIAGGREIFSRAKLVIMETGFEELYTGQPLFDDIYGIMRNMGFSFKGSWGPMKKNLTDGHVLYCDSVFVRGWK